MIPLGVLAATRVVATPAPGYQNLAWTTAGLANWAITDGGRQLEVIEGADSWMKAKASAPKSAGLHYFEVRVLEQHNDLAIGIGPTTAVTVTSSGGTQNAGDGGRLQYFVGGRKRRAGTYEPYGEPYGAGDVIGIAYDRVARTVTAYKNGVSQGVMYSGTQVSTGAYEPHVASYGASAVGTTLRFDPALTYLPPGHQGWTA